MSKTSISWTEFSWNPITGCTKKSEGCKFCYAERMHNRLTGMGSKKYQHPFSEVRCHPEVIDKIYHWRKPRMIFVNSMSDTFHKDVPDEFIMKLFNAMIHNRRHIFQLLTKRPERMLEWMLAHEKNFWHHPDNLSEDFKRDYPRAIHPDPQIWLGVSVENQKAASRIIDLSNTPAAVRFVSFEPLLEDIILQDPPSIRILCNNGRMFDWAIIGCESGPCRRKTKKVPCPDCRAISKVRAALGCTCCRGYGYVHESQLWTENIVTQSTDAGIPVHIKQLELNNRVEKDINKFPKHLQLQEKPEAV